MAGKIHHYSITLSVIGPLKGRPVTHTVQAALLSVLFTLTVSCSKESPPRVLPEDSPLLSVTPVAKPEEVIGKLLNKRTPLPFGSRSGKLYGMDSDTTIAIGTNHQVELTEYGYTVEKYSGTYSVDEHGQIALSLPKYRNQWPVMRLGTNGDDFYLLPESGSTNSVMGGRAGATITPSMASFWPFKLLQTPASRNGKP